MKTATSLLTGLLLMAMLTVSTTAMAANGVQQELTPGSYCHLKFPAIRPETLASKHPVLTNQHDGDIIDYYGSCDEDPLGKDQVHEQKLDNYHRFQHDYED